MAIIDENGMSQKLINFCNENKTFKKIFLSLFTNKTNIKSIEFTGYNETGEGKPDITITFDDDSIFYIEVKTRWNTEFQENQVNNDSGYAKLIKMANQELEVSLGYLLDNFHETTECLTSKIVKWQTIYELVKDFNNLALANDILQNVDGIEEGKVFGDDEEIYSNPFIIASCDLNELAGSEKAKNWILETFVMPALEKYGCTNIKKFGYGKSDDWGANFTFIQFEFNGYKINMDFNGIWVFNLGKNFKYYSFTFYRPWIVGVRTAKSLQEMQDSTFNAVSLWLNELPSILQQPPLDDYKQPSDEEKFFGPRSYIYSNPYYVCYLSDQIDNKLFCKQLYTSIILPALKQVPNIKLLNKGLFEINNHIYIHFIINNQEIKLNLTHYKNLTTKKDYNFNSLIFYRPWIIGCHYAKSPTEMINYAVKAIELWLKDNEII